MTTDERDKEREQLARKAFDRFMVWLEAREFDPMMVKRFMFMGVGLGNGNGKSYYMFKNIYTRNYVAVNIEPSPFNQ